MIENKNLKKRALQISHEHKLSHLGSVLEVIDILVDIFETKKPEDKVVLSQGHAGVGLYVVAEKYLGIDAEKALKEQGIHPDRLKDTQGFIDCSTGSLGQGLPIALGMALADRTKNVYCLISDGEMAEGSIYESIVLIAKLGVSNLRIYINNNGYSGYGETRFMPIDVFGTHRCIFVKNTNVDYLPFLTGLKGHYHTMSESDYLQAMEALK